MIRFVDSASAASPWFRISGRSLTTYGASNPYSSYAVAPVLIQPGLTTTDLGEFHCGSPPVTEPSGILKFENNCSHYNISGTVQLSSSRPIVEEGFPFPLVRRSATQAYSFAPPMVGSSNIGSWAASSTIPQYMYTFDSELRVVDPCQGEWKILASGDKFLLVSELHNGEVRRFSDGLVRVAATDIGGMKAYSFRGGKLYYHSTYTAQYVYSFAEQMSALSAIPNTGGSLVSGLGTLWMASLDSLPTPEKVITALNELGPEAPLPIWRHPTDFGDLSVECESQLDFVDQNLLLLVCDIQDWKTLKTSWETLTASSSWKSARWTYQKLRATGRTPSRRDMKRLFGPGSSMYLSWKYGVFPTSSDLNRLLQGFSRLSGGIPQKTIHARRISSIPLEDSTSCTHTAVMTVYVDAFPATLSGKAMEFISIGKHWGVYPEVINLWDILPYSFVIDWLVQYGDLFEDVDRFLNTRDYFPVRACTQSEKWSVDRDLTTILPELQATGIVTFSYYVRWVTRNVPLPSISLTAEFRLGKHLGETAALISQQI